MTLPRRRPLARGSFAVHVGRVEDVARTLKGPLDAVLCDPPYGLSFMGKAWDRGVPGEAIWRDVSALLRPGAFVAAFGGTRTFHRLACAIEDAGFEIRDCLSWLYGSGFPKSLNVALAVDRLAEPSPEPTNLERRFCRWVVEESGLTPGDFGTDRFHECRVEVVNMATADAPRWGRRSLVPTHGAWLKVRERVQGPVPAWVEECVKPEPRQELEGPLQFRRSADIRVLDPDPWSGYGTGLKPAWEPCVLAMKPLDGTFAANAVEHGVAGLNVDGGRLDTGSTVTRHTRCEGAGGTWEGNRSTGEQSVNAGRWPANVALDEDAAAMLDEQSGVTKSPAGEITQGGDHFSIQSSERSRGTKFQGHGDSGGASRFFYVAKVATAERNAGMAPGDPCRHPTLKPVKLAEWIAKLLLPPPREDGAPRRLLVPFSGAGSEVAGALRAGWDEVVGIEQSAEYAAWAERRVPALVSMDFDAPRPSAQADQPGQAGLFDDVER